MLRRINISLAMIVLITFFLPWEQVSCGGARDTLNGLDLAQNEHIALWLVPLVMLALLVFTLLRHRQAAPPAIGIASIVAGAVAAYLMNDERTRVHDESGLISAQLTGWFWLSFIASIAMIVNGLVMAVRRQRGP